MPATSKSELLAVTEKEFAKLTALLDQIDPEFALEKDADDTSIKDVVAHRAHWIDLFLGWQRDGLAGNEVHFPAKGYKWNELKRYNADLRAAQAELNWPQAREDLSQATARLTDFLTESSNDALYGCPMQGAKNDWTTGRWAEAAGPSHYRSACKFVRARLKEAGSC